MSGHRKTLERELLRLEKLLARHPQWRMMRQAGGRALLVDGVWRFEGLGPAQASALRESLVFRAYQEALLGLARLDAEAKGAASAPADRSGLPQGTGVAESNAQAEVQGEAQAVGRPEPSQRSANAENAREATSATPVTTFRTKLKIKPVGGRGETPPTGAAPTARPPATAPPTEAARTAAVSNDVADDLTRIRSINRALAQRLIAAGVTSFRQIANWNSGEVRRIARDLDLDKRIWRENWIEQAALLAGRAEREARAERSDEQPASIGVVGDEAGDDTLVGNAEGWPAEDGGETVRPHDEAAEAGAVQTPAGGVGDEPAEAQEPVLPDIAGREAALDPAAASAESKAAAADISDRERVRIALMAPSPTFTTPEGVSGIRLHAGREAGNDNAEPGPSAAVEPTRTSVKAGRQARRLPPPSLWQLTYIRGVTDEVAERLRLSGVHSLEEIAAWAQSDVKWFQAILGGGARISGDQWIEQAHMLASGRWTRYALLLEQGKLPTTLVPRPEPVAARRRLVAAASVDAPAGDIEAMVEDAAPVATTAAAEPGRAVATAESAEVAPIVVAGASILAAGAAVPDDRDGMPREVASKEVPEAAVADDAPLSADQETTAAAVVSESDGPPGEEAVSIGDGDGVGADEVAAPLNVSSAVEPAEVAAEPGPNPEGERQQDQASITPEAVSAPEESGPDDAGGAEASMAVASTAPMVVVPPRPVRPAASLFADELVSSLTPGVVPREPDTARDAALPEEPGQTAVSAQGVMGDFGPLDEAVDPTPDSDIATSPEAGPAVAGAQETSHPPPDGSDDAGKRDIEEGAEPDFAVGLLDAEDDFEDAEVLVVRRMPSADPDPAQAKAAEEDDSSELVETVAREASLDAGRPEASSVGRDMAADDGGEDEFTPLGEEASVRIVSRQGPADERTEAAPDVAAIPGPVGLGEEIAEKAERSSGARERLGYSPEYIARRLDVSDDEDEGEDYAGYRDAVEEATVTIIRAKGREEPASAVVPDRIANDQAGSPEDTDSGADEPKRRTLGSRFLRALTGE